MGATRTNLLLVLGGLVFLSIGVGVGASSVRRLVHARAMLAWCEMSAKVLACDFKVSSDSDGTTYRTTAEYCYEVNGVSYTGTRLSLHGGSDNIGSFQSRMHARLEDCRRRNRPTTCWVNPTDPSDAVLDRRPRPELVAMNQLAMLLFGGVGAVVLWAGLALRRSGVSDIGQANRLQMLGATAHRSAVTAAVLWNAYAGWLLWTLWTLLRPTVLPWYLWMWAAVGGVLALVALVMQTRAARFGVSVFEGTAQAVAGGSLSGTVRIPARVDAADGFELLLRCFRRRTTDSGGERSTITECCWENRRSGIGGGEAGTETVIPVRVALPVDVPASLPSGEGDDRVYWRLSVREGAWPFGYRAVFEVPVAAAPPGAVDASVRQAAAPPPSLNEQAQTLGLRYACLADGGFELVCPASHAKGAVAVLSALVIGWGGLCCVLGFVAKVPKVFAVVFALVEGLLVWSWVVTVCVSHELHIDPVRRECLLRRRLLGLSVWERRVPFDQVREFRSASAEKAGARQYYRVRLVPHSGRAVSVLVELTALNGARQIAESLTAVVHPGQGKTGCA